MATASMTEVLSAKDAALAFASQRCFHRSITLAASSSSSSSTSSVCRGDKPRVTFATTSNFDTDMTAPAILFCGGMGASRSFIWKIDAMAKKEGVRVVFIDRPGFGGSTPIPLDRRIETWLKAVPVVLQHLGVAKVALVSHSAGTIYAFNILMRLPHLLHSEKPYAALLTPWVHPSHSSAPLMQIVNHLPSAMVGSLHHITSFVIGYIAPSIQFSSGMIGVTDDDLPEDQCRKYYDTDSKTWTEVCTLQGKWMREEDMSGISADANLCMQKDSRDWGSGYENLPAAISTLLTTYPEQTRRNLTIKAYFAQTDKMIGKGGQRYFERCWKDGNSDGEIVFETKVVQGTDHDSITLVEKGCLGAIFKEVKELSG